MNNMNNNMAVMVVMHWLGGMAAQTMLAKCTHTVNKNYNKNSKSKLWHVVCKYQMSGKTYATVTCRANRCSLVKAIQGMLSKSHPNIGFDARIMDKPVDEFESDALVAKALASHAVHLSFINLDRLGRLGSLPTRPRKNLACKPARNPRQEYQTRDFVQLVDMFAKNWSSRAWHCVAAKLEKVVLPVSCCGQHCTQLADWFAVVVQVCAARYARTNQTIHCDVVKQFCQTYISMVGNMSEQHTRMLVLSVQTMAELYKLLPGYECAEKVIIGTLQNMLGCASVLGAQAIRQQIWDYGLGQTSSAVVTVVFWFALSQHLLAKVASCFILPLRRSAVVHQVVTDIW
jgi:hypothetical protein